MAIEGLDMQLLVLADARDALSEDDPLACAVCFELEELCMCGNDSVLTPIAVAIRVLRERIEEHRIERTRSADVA